MGRDRQQRPVGAVSTAPGFPPSDFSTCTPSSLTRHNPLFRSHHPHVASRLTAAAPNRCMLCCPLPPVARDAVTLPTPCRSTAIALPTNPNPFRRADPAKGPPVCTGFACMYSAGAMLCLHTSLNARPAETHNQNTPRNPRQKTSPHHITQRHAEPTPSTQWAQLAAGPIVPPPPAYRLQPGRHGGSRATAGWPNTMPLRDQPQCGTHLLAPPML